MPNIVDPQTSASKSMTSSRTANTTDVEEAISVARFNRNLLALVTEQDSSTRRIEELEKALQQAQQQYKSQIAQTSVVEGKLREATGRHEESHQERLRADKAAEDERSRHALTRRAHETSSAGVLTKVSEQGQQIHSLEEMLRSKESECVKLKQFQESAQGLIGTFREKLSEVGTISDLAVESERSCREALGSVREDQSHIRSLLEACKERQCLAVSSEKLRQQLRAAHEEAGESQMRTTQCEERLQQTLKQLERTQGAEASARASCAEKSAHFDQQQALLQRAEQQLAMHSELLNRALKRGMKVGEKNEELIGRLLRSDAVVKMLQRELMHAEAETNGATVHAAATLEAQAARVRTAEAREAMLSDQLKHALQELDSATALVYQLSSTGAALEERLAAAGQHGLSSAANESAADAAAPAPASAVSPAAAAEAHGEPGAAPSRACAPATEACAPTPSPSVVESVVAPESSLAPAVALRAGAPSSAAAEAAYDPPSREGPLPDDRPSSLSACTSPEPNGAWASSPAYGSFDGSGSDAWTSWGLPPAPVEPPAVCQTSWGQPPAPTQPASACQTSWDQPSAPVEPPAASQRSWGQPSAPVELPAACQTSAPDAAPAASCGKCREPLFGATAACSKCGKAFHASCCNRRCTRVGIEGGTRGAGG